jgi:ATP-dependent helicase/nuclease subunit B
VLHHFHSNLANGPATDAAQRSALMDEAATHTTAAMALPDGEFLPFLAAWPAVRRGYLEWLSGHDAQGFVFAASETDHRQRLGDIQLSGRIDRMDRARDGSILVLDYKTEPPAKTRGRVKSPLEDTQIAFYAALLPDDTLRGAYVNVGERDGTAMTEQLHIVQARDALIEGIVHDIHGIAEGQPLPALGDGAACDFCQARGLCRKDFWL